MSEKPLPCPLCGDPMRIRGPYFRHVADTDSACILSRHAWPIEDLPRWNHRPTHGIDRAIEVVERLKNKAIAEQAKQPTTRDGNAFEPVIATLILVLRELCALPKPPADDTELVEALALVLPLAKAHTALHPHDVNKRCVKKAETALTAHQEG